jgi:hypothetical protein
MAHNRITITHARICSLHLRAFLCCGVDHDDRTAGPTPMHGGSGCDSSPDLVGLLHAGLESALTAGLELHTGGGRNPLLGLARQTAFGCMCGAGGRSFDYSWHGM